ncbi:MAG: YHYH protein [Bacteroidota bacterium]
MKNIILLLISISITSVSYSQCVSADIFAEETDNAVCFEVIDNIRYIYSNGLPDHDDNHMQGNSIPSDPTAQEFSYTMCAYPVEAANFTPLYEETETTVGCEFNYKFGVSINGIKYDPNSAETFTNSDGSNNIDWHVEATSTTNSIGVGMGTTNGGHINPSGEYHYHNIPTDYFINDLGIDGSAHSPLVGYAADGFPIYYKYVYSDADDELSAIESATSGYSLKSGDRGGDGLTAPDGAYDGNYYEDYEFIQANTILDECNGRYGVTPDFPYGTYYYVLTDEYPYIPRCFKGEVVDNTFRVGPESSCVTNKNATQGDCADVVSGCMDPFSSNYDPNANLDDGSCTYASTSWNGSWSNSTGPDDGNSATLTTDYTFSTDGKFTCDDLTVNAGITLTVDSEEALVVNGNITNNGTIVIESGGSLITYDGNTMSGDITIKRETRYADGKYSFVGSPMQQASSITGSDLGSVVYEYDETQGFADQGINRWIDASGSELVPGRGYAQAFQKEISFTGTPNSGTIVYSGTFTDLPNANPEGWNLVSNPYPAAISVTGFLAANSNTNGAVYFWDDNNSESARGTSSDYITANGIAVTQNSNAGNSDRFNQHIGAMQGFFVKLNDASNTDITFNESMRVSTSNADDNYYRESNNIPFVRINLSNESGVFKQAIIGWTKNTDDDIISNIYDAEIINQEAANALYSMKNEKALVIQGINEKSVIDLGMNLEKSGVYTIDLKNEFDEKQVFLKDLRTGSVVDISARSYTFYTDGGVNIDRFKLLTENEMEEQPTGFEEAHFYVGNKNLIIRQNDEQSLPITVFNLSGQLLMTQQVTGNDQISLAAFSPGIYLIHDGKKTKKIFLK